MDLVLSKNAKKHFSQLPPPQQRKLKKKLQSLELNPLSGKKLSGELSNDRSLKSWPYRIIYTINNKLKRVEVSEILHRQGVYK